MLEKYNIEHILFLDIETVPQYPGYAGLPQVMAPLWDKKSSQAGRFEKPANDDPADPDVIYERAGIYAEFGKIICISTGVVRNGSLWIKSFSGHDERELLIDFIDMLNKAKDKKFGYLCAHNGKEFDYPYLIRRMLINRLEVPPILDLSEKKPWEIAHLDTMELWKFGDYKSYTSLELLAAVFGIPTPKDDIKGSDVARVYWKERDLERIVTYCQKDVITIVNLFLCFKGKPILPEGVVQIVA